jgi:hypothetical protein
VAEVEKRDGEFVKALEKEKRRVEKLKEVLAEWRVSVGFPSHVLC